MAYSSITKPSDHFNTKLYTGNSSNNHAITGVGFQPDFTWIKNRGGDWNILTDSIRGVTKLVYSNSTAAEDTDSTYIQSFDSNGFTLGTNTDVNENSNNYASWNWLGANGTASNSNGSINSTVSANTTAGFSIVTFQGTGSSGQTVGHGLGVTPQVIISKDRDSTEAWSVHTTVIDGSMDYLRLAGTDAAGNSSFSAPNSTVFGYNPGSGGYVAYVFAEKKGYSKFASYTGNGNADGTFVYTGFKPAFILQKNASATGNWILYDNKRDVDNVADKILIPNSSSAEATACDVDLLSNGFKFRAVNDASSNKSGNTYIYMAFAEEPLVANVGVSIPATAR